MSICVSFHPVLAQSSGATMQAEPSLPTHLTNVPSAYIVGYSLDEDGKPVSMANVSLWQDSQLWSTERVLVPSNNPQTTRVAYTNESGTLGDLKEGGFLFGFVAPGNYTLTAEKDGYKNSSVNVHVGEETISPNQLESVAHAVAINITLDGYHVPTLTSSQLANTGAIIGKISSQFGYGSGNVSLWQDGQLVTLPDNPQMSFRRSYAGKGVDYVFEHLPPGHYTVKVLYHAGPTDQEDAIPVDVGTGIVTADIMLTHMIPLPRPTPALPGLVTLLMIGLVTYYLLNKK
jgi:hypothetical protein